MWSLENFKVSEILCVTTFNTISNPSFYRIVYTIPWGVIIIERAKNHVKRPKNCQCVTHIYGEFIMSMGSHGNSTLLFFLKVKVWHCDNFHKLKCHLLSCYFKIVIMEIFLQSHWYIWRFRLYIMNLNGVVYFSHVERISNNEHVFYNNKSMRHGKKKMK
jgi:hypothetical protein